MTTEIEQARAAERQRIGEILGSTASAGRETLANHLAFKTEIDAPEAIEMLRATPMVAADGCTNQGVDQGTVRCSLGATCSSAIATCVSTAASSRVLPS